MRSRFRSRSSQVFTVPEQFVPRGTDPKELEARFQQVCGHGWKKKDNDGDCFSFFFLQSLVKIGLNVFKCSQILLNSPRLQYCVPYFSKFSERARPQTPLDSTRLQRSRQRSFSSILKKFRQFGERSLTGLLKVPI